MFACAIGHRARAAGALTGALLLAGWPAAAAPTAPPRSILPELFDEAPPPPRDVERLPPAPQAFPEPPARAPATPAAGVATTEPATDPAAPPPPSPWLALPGPQMLAADAGLVGREALGGDRLFEGADGPFLAALAQRWRGPLANRWTQILVQRALAARGAPPQGLLPGDWAAARAGALLALGNAADAHRMLLAIRIEDYTPALYAVAAEAAAAAGDPLALCPLAATGRALAGGGGQWRLAEGLCAAVAGETEVAQQLFAQARRRDQVAGFDLGLAERLASALGGAQRSFVPEWDEVEALTPWRVGLLAANAISLPDPLVDAAEQRHRGWMARLPGLGSAQRARLAPLAAGLGLVSSTEANRLWAAEGHGLERGQALSGPAGRLAAAHGEADAAERLAALRALWAEAPPNSIAYHGWLAITASAAATIPPDAAHAADAPQLVAALLSAGLMDRALAWWPALAAAPEAARADVWALLAPLHPIVPIDQGLYERWAQGAGPHRARVLSRGLAGLGRPLPRPPADDSPASPGWLQALDAEARAGRAGGVLLLAASGLPVAPEGRALSPAHLEAIARALSAVGLRDEATLIVSEAGWRG